MITDTSDELLIKGLTALGYECTYDPGIIESSLLKVIHQYVGLIVATRIVVHKQLLKCATQLKFLARAGSGMENIDVKTAKAMNIICINSPEGNANAVGEHALALLLSFYHNIVKSNSQIHQFKWMVEENRVHEMEGRTLGIIGYGNTGRAFAKKLKPLNMNVIAYDKYLKNYRDEYAEPTDLQSMFKEAEIVSLHIPLTQETICLVDQQFLQKFRKKIFLINTARGKLIVHDALLKQIRNGGVIGAALDVYDNEKFETHNIDERNVLAQLLETGQVIMTPHVAGKSFESRRKIAEVLLTKIAAIT